MNSQTCQFRDTELHGFGFHTAYDMVCGLIGSHHEGFPRGFGQFGIHKAKSDIGDMHTMGFEF
jgi:hypothetical protein